MSIIYILIHRPRNIAQQCATRDHSFSGSANECVITIMGRGHSEKSLFFSSFVSWSKESPLMDHVGRGWLMVGGRLAFFTSCISSFCISHEGKSMMWNCLGSGWWYITNWFICWYQYLKERRKPVWEQLVWEQHLPANGLHHILPPSNILAPTIQSVTSVDCSSELQICGSRKLKWGSRCHRFTYLPSSWSSLPSF